MSNFERFLDSPFPGYKVGDRGTVVSYKGRKPRVRRTYRGKVDEYVRLNINGKQRGISVGRLVLLTFVGPPPEEGLICCHGERGNYCHDLDNLSWGTYRKNNLDKVRDGTVPRGEKVASAKLTEADVIAMRARCYKGETAAALAREYGVSRWTARTAIVGRTWSHVPGRCLTKADIIDINTRHAMGESEESIIKDYDDAIGVSDELHTTRNRVDSHVPGPLSATSEVLVVL